MKKALLLTTTLLVLSLQIFAQDFSQWRGVDRTGVYSEEKGLLKVWPENGPKMLWFHDRIPNGYSSVSIANNTIYLTGIKDTMDVVLALDLNGKELWQTTFGRAWDGSYQNSRATPTIEKDNLYISSGRGDIACLNAKNGEIKWSVKASEEFGGTIGKWGLAESLLIDENYVFYTPGGNQTTMIAFDKGTGELVWKSESLKDNPSYTSPLMVHKDGKRIIVNITQTYIIGVQPQNGNILWKFDFKKYRERRNNYANTPLYYDGGLFVSNGYNHASVKLKLADDLSSASLMWVDTVLDIHHGGAVKIGDYIYGSNWEHNRMGKWVCLDWNTGKVMYETKWKNKGSIISADGMLYCSEEKTGYVALVNVNPKEFKVISSFKTPKGTGPYWAHPVINNGLLYVRHGTALMVYDIKN
ncbi:MAG: alcohol dehydrogenase [Bacteroidetes bacterium]|nr:MAG: alcohol dehydrogenase [Bacteroidota bacterium]